MYRLLIVEDDFRIAEVIKEQMKMWDLDAHIVEDFRSTLTDFTAYQPHIVLEHRKAFHAAYRYIRLMLCH